MSISVDHMRDLETVKDAPVTSRYVVIATNPAVAYASWIDTSESVVCAGFETSDLNELTTRLHGGIDSPLQHSTPAANMWFPISIFKITDKGSNLYLSVLEGFYDAFDLAKVLNIVNRDALACLARAECERLLSMRWANEPRIFSIPAERIIDHPLYTHLPNHNQREYQNDNIIAKQIIDKEIIECSRGGNFVIEDYF